MEPIPAVPAPPLSVSDLIKAEAKPILTDLSTQLLGSFQADIATAQTTAQQALNGHGPLADRLAALERQAEAGLAHLGNTVEIRAETDPWIARILVTVGSLACAVVAAIITWFVADGAIHGNQEALAIVAGVGTALTPLIAWIVRRFAAPTVTVPVASLPSVSPAAVAMPILQATQGIAAGTPVTTTTTVGA